jgi:large subunit ribosomal protein L23
MALFGAKKATTEDTKKTTKSTKEVKEVKAVKKVEKTVSETSMKDLYSENGTVVVKSDKAGAVSQEIGKINKHILVRPLITEKAAHLNESNKYAFVVKLNANKILIAKEVAAIYGVKVEGVNLIRMKGKKVAKGKIKGKRSDFKKAIVTLAKGQTIKLYEGV